MLGNNGALTGRGGRQGQGAGGAQQKTGHTFGFFFVMEREENDFNC